MSSIGYRGVEIVLAEQSGGFAEVLAPALMAKGVRELVVCHDAHAMCEILATRAVDVIMCDLELPGMNFAKTVQGIRHNEIGNNPFVQIVATMNESARPMVRAAIEAGVDDVIRKPMPADKVVSRVEQLVKPRRPFAITESFIGPNRRQRQRAAENVYLMSVPNTLRFKVLEKLPANEVQDRVFRTWLEVVDRKGRVRPEAILKLADRVLAFFNGEIADESVHRDLRYLVSKGEELIARCEGAGHIHLNALADSMRGVVEGLTAAPHHRRRTHVRLMPDLSRAAHKSLTRPQTSVGTVHEIAQAVREWLDADLVADLPEILLAS
jgi:two-component system, chemotaxis family, chemotaxis protein CheY